MPDTSRLAMMPTEVQYNLGNNRCTLSLIAYVSDFTVPLFSTGHSGHIAHSLIGDSMIAAN
jgi:hypothetical protein